MEWINSVSRFIFPFFESLPFVRAALGIILVFFLPGFVWSICFFRQLRIIERITISLALSIVLVTLSLLFFNRLTGIKLNGPNAVLIILVVTILPVIAYYLNRFIRRKLSLRGQEE